MSTFNSCKNNQDDLPCCDNFSVAWRLYVRNSLGDDLLNPKTSDHYNYSDIKHYSIENGIRKMLDNGKNRMVSYPDPNTGYNDYSIIIFDLGRKITNTPYPVYESFIELSSNSVDTIKVETLESDHNTSLRKIWYNNNLIWEVGEDNITIVK